MGVKVTLEQHDVAMYNEQAHFCASYVHSPSFGSEKLDIAESPGEGATSEYQKAHTNF